MRKRRYSTFDYPLVISRKARHLVVGSPDFGLRIGSGRLDLDEISRDSIGRAVLEAWTRIYEALRDLERTGSRHPRPAIPTLKGETSMSRHNSCFVVGHVGMDPIEKENPKHGPMVKFTVAENVIRFDEKKKSYETVHTNWFQVTAFGPVAKRAKGQIKKGQRVAIQGRMKISKFTDRSGEERSGFEILADEVALWQSLPAAGAADRVDDAESLPF